MIITAGAAGEGDDEASRRSALSHRSGGPSGDNAAEVRLGAAFNCRGGHFPAAMPGRPPAAQQTA
jgi:hypothetical protein